MKLNLKKSLVQVKDALVKFINSSRRVFIIAKKPDWNEFQTMAKVTGVGIIVIAVIAYVIYIVFAFTPLG